MTAPLPICVLKNGRRVRRTKLDSGLDEPGTVAAGADHDQRAAWRPGSSRRRPVERRRVGHRALDRMHRDDRGGSGIDLLGRHVLRQFEMHRPRPLLHGHAEGVAHDGRDAGRR